MTPSTSTTQILDSIRRIVRVLRETSRAAEERVGVSAAQLFVLKVLSSTTPNRQPLSLNQLAERTHTHQSTVSVVVKRLVAMGLVRRVDAPDDARRLQLTVTEPGRALLRRSPMAGQERLVEGIAQLSVQKRESLAKALAELTRLMGLDDTRVSMFFEEPMKRNSHKKLRRARGA